MTDDPSYRMYLEERFKEVDIQLQVQTQLINAQFINVNDKLDNIETHVLATNGRVGELECESLKRQKAVDDFRKLETEISSVKKEIKKKWFWYLIGIIIFISIIASVGEFFGIRELFRLWFAKM